MRVNLYGGPMHSRFVDLREDMPEIRVIPRGPIVVDFAMLGADCIRPAADPMIYLRSSRCPTVYVYQPQEPDECLFPITVNR